MQEIDGNLSLRCTSRVNPKAVQNLKAAEAHPQLELRGARAARSRAPASYRALHNGCGRQLRCRSLSAFRNSTSQDSRLQRISQRMEGGASGDHGPRVLRPLGNWASTVVLDGRSFSLSRPRTWRPREERSTSGAAASVSEGHPTGKPQLDHIGLPWRIRPASSPIGKTVDNRRSRIALPRRAGAIVR
jgi:hypothetical protein